MTHLVIFRGILRRAQQNARTCLSLLAALVLLVLLVAVTADAQDTTPDDDPRRTRDTISQGSHGDVRTIQERIAALTPAQPIAGGARFRAVSLLGYDLLAPLDDDKKPHVIAGETYPFVIYMEVKKPGDLDFDLVVKLGDMFVSRQRIQISDAHPGEVIKKEINVRIPLTCPVGQSAVFMSLLDVEPPLLAGGGSVMVENRRVPLISSKRRASCKCWTRGNLIPDPSFEDRPRDLNWIPGEHSRKYVFGYSQLIDNSEAHCGKRSLMVDFHGGVDVSAWVKGVEIPVSPGREYDFAFCYKTADLPKVPEGMRGPCVQIIDADNDSVRIGLLDLAKPGAPAEWTERARTFSVPNGTKNIRIRIRRYGAVDRGKDWADPVKKYPAGGTVWIDCMWLVPSG